MHKKKYKAIIPNNVKDINAVNSLNKLGVEIRKR